MTHIIWKNDVAIVSVFFDDRGNSSKSGSKGSKSAKIFCLTAEYTYISIYVVN